MNSNSDMNAEPDRQGLKEAQAKTRFSGVEFALNNRFLTKAASAVSKVIYRVDRIFGDLVAISLGLGIAFLWIASSALESQSTDLTVLRPNFKIWFAEAFNGREAEFGRLELAWQPVDNQIVVNIEDAEIRGEDGTVLENFVLVRSTLELSDKILSTPRLVNVQVHGGVISLIEDENGKVTAGLGPPETVGRVGPVYRSDQVRKSKGGIKSFLQDLEFVQVQDATFFLKNHTSGIDLESDVELLRANFSQDGGMAVTARGSVDQRSEALPYSVNVISDADFESIRVRLNVEDARLDEIGPKRGRFWEFQGLSAPVDLVADIDFSRIDGLRSASVEVDVDSGKFHLLREGSSRSFPIDSLKARASLAPGNERMDVEVLDVESPNLSFKSSGFLSELGNLSDGDENSSPVFDLSLKNIRADLKPMFPTVTNVKGLDIRGQADVDSRTLEISQGKIQVFETTHEFNGALFLDKNNGIKSVKFNSSMTGTLTPAQFLSLWPVRSFEGARGWIEGAILEADIGLVESEIDFDEAFFQNPVLTEDRLKFRFGGENVTVKYVKTLPAATGIHGTGEIIGNALNVSYSGGQVGAIELIGGSAVIPRLRPKNGDIIVSVDGRGSVSDLLRLADHPPYKIASRYNVDADKLTGLGDVSLTVTRALTPFLPPEKIDYTIIGNFFGASVPIELGDYSVSNGTLRLEANRERALITGPVEIGPWKADVSWLESFGESAPPTQYGVSGTIDANVLDKLGFASRSVFDGSAFLKVDAYGRGMDISGGRLDLDLTNSELSLERIWMKSAGDPAKLTGDLTRSADGGYSINNARVNGTGIDVSGQISLGPDYKLRDIDMPQVTIKSLIDGAVKITPDRLAQRLSVILDAEFLDVSPWTEDLFEQRQSDLDVPLRLQGTVKDLVLADSYPVTESEIYFSHTGEVIETARLEALSDGEPLKLEMTTREDLKRQFDVSVPDASKAIFAFMGLDNTKGGRLKITANLPAAGESGAYVGEADMRDFKLREAPALAQLLSLASLTGLADTLTGGSMKFDRFKVPFAILGDDIAIRDARLYGPAIGMTGNGDINLTQRDVDFDGTLVPAYTANSILGDIPLLGDIFVREKDGGLFALTYTVSGPFEQTQITVNPLSALTPGFLRGIFKRDRSEIDDAMKEAIEDVQPKNEVEPDEASPEKVE